MSSTRGFCEVTQPAPTDFYGRYGPVALVTGASSGIGKSFAQALAARGMDLVLVARRVNRLETLAAQLRAAHGVQVTVCEVDLGDEDAVHRIMGATSALDVGLVISNAGYGLKGDHAAHDPQAMAAMLLVNCNAPMQLSNGFIPRLRKRGKGGILFVSSVEALMGCPALVPPTQRRSAGMASILPRCRTSCRPTMWRGSRSQLFRTARS